MTSVCNPMQPSALRGESAAPSPPGVTASMSPVPRPDIVRRETDQILSYYQSEHAGRSSDYQPSAAPDCASSPPFPTTTTTTTIPTPAPIQSQTTATQANSRARGHARQNSAFSSGSDYSSVYSESDDPPAPSGPPTARAPPSRSDVSNPRTVGAAPSSTPFPRKQEEAASGVDSGRGEAPVARHSRRISVPSEGGADRRRVAIVEMDALPPTTPLAIGRKRSKGIVHGKSSSSVDSSASAMGGGGSTLFSRRGMHIGGLALVAPPDACPKTYTNLTPPSTAPVSSTGSSTAQGPPSAFIPSHTRSASEAVDGSGSRSRLNHKRSRDVGIVGLSSASTASESVGPASPTSDDYNIYVQTEGLGVPIFQTPAKSRSPSPGVATPELSDTSSGSAFRSPHQRLLSTPIYGMEDGIVTPGIGEGKDIRQPVVGPVIVGLSSELLHGHQDAANVSAASRGFPSIQSPTSSSPSYNSPSSTSSSQFLHYQPGVHATAGPLPPPPRSIFERDTAAPPRPPRYHTPLPPGARRDIDAIKEALQLPESVSAKLAARTPPESDKHLDGETGNEGARDARSQESAYSQESDSEPSIKLVSSKAVHVREGAFPPSKILSFPPGVDTQVRSEPRPMVLVEQDESEEDHKEPERRPGIELHRESSWVSLGQENTPSSPNGKSSGLPSVSVSVSRSPSSLSESSSSSSVSYLPSLPPKSLRHHGSEDEKAGSSLAPSAFKALTNLKRFSALPRTPSRSSKSSKRSTSPDPRRSISPPPPPPVQVESPPRRRVMPKPKYAHPWPPAMNAADVVVLRGGRERARAYAMKINELSMYDCGLRDWLASQSRTPATHLRAQSQRTARSVAHTVPSEFGGMTEQGRHLAQASIASEMTFPIRADAYTATDLSTRPTDAPPTTAPPAILPYPSLAQVQIQRAPIRSSTLLLSPTKSLQIPLPGTKGSGTGFFASLGRKTSIRKDKGSLLSSSPQSPTKVLMKHRPQVITTSQSVPPSSRPIATPAPPSIPGGPRAAPGHMQRSKTFSVGGVSPQASPPSTSHGPPQAEGRLSGGPQPSAKEMHRLSAMPSRRPSLFARARPGHSSVMPAGNRPVNVAMSDPAFQQQVDKLAALLPHADRTVLAGYLRRAGEDILAIGQYLEDEKNGRLRRD